jgi:hypothetical protein
MASNARGAGDWRWAEELRGEGLGFAPFNVMAVFDTLPSAEQAVRRLRDLGLPNDQISLRSRTQTDDPSARRVEPAVEVPTRRRDAQVAGRVARRIVGLSLMVAAAAALVGLLVAVLAGFSSLVLVLTVVVAAVAGAVVGAVWGGEIGSMREARKEEGVVVGAHVDDREAAARAESVLRGVNPVRIDLHDAQGRPILQL